MTTIDWVKVEAKAVGTELEFSSMLPPYTQPPSFISFTHVATVGICLLNISGGVLSPPFFTIKKEGEGP